MHRILPLAVACLALLVGAPSAHAMLYGVESNSELINSDRTPALQAQALDRMRAQGAGVVRVNVGWNEVAANCDGQSHVQLRNPDNPCYNWSIVDGLVQQANARQILVLATVSRAPVWLQNNTNVAYLGTTSAEWNRSVLHFSAFMGAIAERYRIGSAHGMIRLFTVWNEPNSPQYFKPMHTRFLLQLAPRRYAQLFARSAVQIRSANPYALVAPGPTGPTGSRTGIPPVTFIASFQRALPAFLPGRTIAIKRRYLSAWAHNPYPGIGTPPSRGTARSPYVGMGNIRDLFVQLDRAPITRGLRVWATEFGYQTNPPDRMLGVNPHLQGRYVAESFDWLHSTRRVTVAIWYGHTDPVNLVDWQSGTYYSNGRAKPSLQWWRRPISVPVDSVRRGGVVRIWARSNVNPRATRVMMSTNGRQWRVLPISGRQSDFAQVRAMRLYRTTWFAVWDGQRGPARVVRVR